MPAPVASRRSPNDVFIHPRDSERDALRRLKTALEAGDEEYVRKNPLPEGAWDAMCLAVKYLAIGVTVTVEPCGDALTPKRVADLMQVPESFVVELMNRHELSWYLTPDGYRLMTMATVLAHRERVRAAWLTTQPPILTEG